MEETDLRPTPKLGICRVYLIMSVFEPYNLQNQSSLAETVFTNWLKVLPLGHQHTPHTLSPNMSVPMMDDLVVLGYPRTIPCDVEDSTAHGSKLTHNHQVYRKPTTIWHPGNETCKANVKKKQNPEEKGWVIEFTTFDDPLRFHHANQGAPHLLGEYPWRRCLKKLHQSLVLGRLLCRLLTYRYV